MTLYRFVKACAFVCAGAFVHLPSTGHGQAETRPLHAPATAATKTESPGPTQAEGQGVMAEALPPDTVQPPVPPRYVRAHALFQAGVRAAMRGEWQPAADAFTASADLVPRPSTLYNLALAQQELGQRIEATETLNRYLDVTASHTEAHDESDDAAQAQRSQVQALRSELTAQLASLTVRPSPSGATLQLNHEPLEGHKPRWLEPGDYHLTASAPGHVTAERQTALHAGEVRTLDITLAPAPQPGPTRPTAAPLHPSARDRTPTDNDSNVWHSPWLWTGVAGAVAAVVVTAIVLSANDTPPGPTGSYGGSANLRL